MRVTGRRTCVGLALVVLVLTAGCSGGAQLAGGDGDGGQQSGPEVDVAASGGATAMAEPEERESGEDGGSAGQADGPAQVRDRSIIRTGQVRLRVDDFDATQRNLTRSVRRYGGFVSDSSVEVARADNATYKSGTLVLRVPRENFSALLTRTQTAGEVESVNRNSEDVTDQLVDMNARLENLRAERERLRQLYRNASDTEDVLAVEERLSDVQGEIERLEARQQSLQRRVALSTVRVELREPRPVLRPDTDRWFDTPVLAALLQSVDGALTSLRALVVAGAYGLPYAVVYGPLVVGAAFGVRRLRRGRGGDPGPEPRPAESTGPSSEDDAGDPGGDRPDGDPDADTGGPDGDDPGSDDQDDGESDAAG